MEDDVARGAGSLRFDSDNFCTASQAPGHDRRAGLVVVVLGHVLVLREDRLGQDGAADEGRIAERAVSELFERAYVERARTVACSPACIPAIAQSSAGATEFRLRRPQAQRHKRRTGRTVAGAAAVSSRRSRVSSPFILLPPPHSSTLSSLAPRQPRQYAARLALSTMASAHLPAIIVDARLDAGQKLFSQPCYRLAAHATRVEDGLASARQHVCRHCDCLAVRQRVRRPLPR